MRVCLFTDSADPSGMGVHMLTLARALRGGAQVSLLFADTPGARPFAAQARAEGFAAEALAVRDWTVERALRDRLAALRPALVHAHAGVQWEGLWIARAVRGACGAPTVRTEHLPYLLTKTVDQAEHAAALPGFAAVICVSLGARLGHLGRDPTGRDPVLVRNGVARDAPRRSRAQVRAALAIAQDAPVLLTVARLFEQKGHAVLLRALAQLDRPEVVALWAGEGELAAPLARAVDETGLAGRVRLLGRRDDVPDLLAAADLFVLPSLFEGHPLSVLEAMHAGTPVVATDVAGTREALADGVEGRLVAPNDPGALAAALAEALDRPAPVRRQAQAARRRAERDFSAERMARETAAVYARVLAHGSLAREDA